MPADLRRAASLALGAATAAGIAYTAFALLRVRAFARRPAERARSTPHVTILKPLHGATAELAENLRSFCEQDYPAYDVVLGTRDPADAAFAVAREVAAAYPQRVRVACADAQTPQHANPKASTLAALLPHARGEILVIADDDMRVDREYLRALVASFDDPAVGAATCLYRGRDADRRLASRLGALANHEHFAPSVLVALALGPLHWCFGATMAMRRSTFDAIGGLAAIGTHLADDARLGELVSASGERVALSRYVIENVVAEPSLRALFLHDLRWARTHRAVAPAGYAGLFVTYPLALALLHLALARRRAPALALAALAAIVRLALGAAACDAFGTQRRAPLALAALSDTLGLATWAASFVSRRVDWSGDRLAVRADGVVTGAAVAARTTILVPHGAEALAVRLGTLGRARIVGIAPGDVPRDLALGRADAIVVMGLCGALDPALRIGDVVAYRGVSDGAVRFACDPSGAAALQGARVVDAFTSARVVTTVAERATLAERTAADVVDMEGTSIAMAMAARGRSYATLRVVSDDASRDLPPVAAAVVDGRIDGGAVAVAFLRDPRGALAFARDALTALVVLARTAHAVASG